MNMNIVWRRFSKAKKGKGKWVKFVEQRNLHSSATTSSLGLEDIW
jgi:hypothetical protein